MNVTNKYLTVKPEATVNQSLAHVSWSTTVYRKTQ